VSRDQRQSDRDRTVRFWTALIIYAGAGWAAVEVFLAARDQFLLPDALDTVVVGLFIAGFLATVILLKARVTTGVPPILQALRAFAVVLLLAALALLIAYWLEPNQAERAAALVAGTRPGHFPD